MGTNDEKEPDPEPVQPAVRKGGRTPYAVPRLVNLGAAAVVTNAVMMMGLMDGFMGRRTG